MCVCVCVCLCVCTREVVCGLELVGDVTTLQDLQDQVFSLRLHLLLQGDLYLPHHLGLTWRHTRTHAHTHARTHAHAHAHTHTYTQTISFLFLGLGCIQLYTVTFGYLGYLLSKYKQFSNSIKN